MVLLEWDLSQKFKSNSPSLLATIAPAHYRPANDVPHRTNIRFFVASSNDNANSRFGARPAQRQRRTSAPVGRPSDRLNTLPGAFTVSPPELVLNWVLRDIGHDTGHFGNKKHKSAYNTTAMPAARATLAPAAMAADCHHSVT